LRFGSRMPLRGNFNLAGWKDASPRALLVAPEKKGLARPDW
jgi:hypothetical protein